MGFLLRLAVFLATLLLVASTRVVPLSTAYAGVDLNANANEYEPGHFRARVQHTLPGGKSLELRYDVVHAAQTHSIHELEGLHSVKCPTASSPAVLSFSSPEAAQQAASRMSIGHRVVGHHACRYEDDASALILVATADPVVEGSHVRVASRQGVLTDVFRRAEVHFTTDILPGTHVPAKKQEEEVVGVATERGRSLKSWWSATWGDVKHLAGRVKEVVHNVAEVALELVNGDMQIDHEWTKSLFSYNFDHSTQHAQGPFHINAAISCDACYANLDAKVDLKLTIDDHVLHYFDAHVTGQAAVGLGASGGLKGEVHASLDLGTYSVPRITFVVGGFPVTIKFTVPMTLGADVLAQVNSVFQHNVGGSGSLMAGVSWHDGAFHPYADHAMSFSGPATKPVGGQVSATVSITPVIVMNINFLGGPSFTFRPWGQVLVDSTECASNQLQLTVNAGMQGVVGAGIHITVDHQTLFDKSMDPITVLSQAWGIQSVCLTYSSALNLFADNATSVAFLPGAVWHGVQKLVSDTPACEAEYAHAVDYSLQLLDVNGTTGQFVLAGNAWDVIENQTGYCVFQQLMEGSIGNTTLTMTAMLDSDDNYYSCSIDFPVKASLLAYRFLDPAGFQLAGVHDDNCTTGTLTAPAPQL